MRLLQQKKVNLAYRQLKSMALLARQSAINRANVGSMSKVLRLLNSERNKKAVIVQSLLRKVTALKKLRAIQVKLQKQRIATKLQSYVKMHLQR